MTKVANRSSLFPRADSALTATLQADVVAFVNEYLVSAGPRTRRMLCVAQGLAHAQSSEFPALAASQPGAAPRLPPRNLEPVVETTRWNRMSLTDSFVQETRSWWKERHSCRCSNGSNRRHRARFGPISTHVEHGRSSACSFSCCIHFARNKSFVSRFLDGFVELRSASCPRDRPPPVPPLTDPPGPHKATFVYSSVAAYAVTSPASLGKFTHEPTALLFVCAFVMPSGTATAQM